MDIAALEKLLESGTDNALLRYSLAGACHRAGRTDEAITHLKRALEHDEQYSAAWKLYGRVLADAGRKREAMDVYRRGIEVAEDRGDVQAAREMRVFLKRLERQ